MFLFKFPYTEKYIQPLGKKRNEADVLANIRLYPESLRGGESLRKVLCFRRPMGRQGRALYACSLPEETYDTLVDSLGLAQGRNTSLLHDLETGHLRCFMGVVRIHDLA